MGMDTDLGTAEVVTFEFSSRQELVAHSRVEPARGLLWGTCRMAVAPGVGTELRFRLSLGTTEVPGLSRLLLRGQVQRVRECLHTDSAQVLVRLEGEQVSHLARVLAFASGKFRDLARHAGPRYEVSLPVDYLAGAQGARGLLADLSRGGARIVGGEPPELGPCELKVKLGFLRHLVLPSQVVWRRDGAEPSFGVKFQTLSPPAQAWLTRTLAGLQQPRAAG